MSENSKKVLGIIALGIIAESSILLLVYAIMTFASIIVIEGSGSIIAMGVLYVIEFALLMAMSVFGIINTARDDFHVGSYFLKAAFLIDLLFIIIFTIISLSSFATLGIVIVLIVAIVSLIFFLISILISNEKASAVLALIGLVLLTVDLPIRIVFLHQSGVLLGSSISNIVLVVLSYILFISELISPRRPRSVRSKVGFRLGESIYTKFDLFDANHHKVPALSKVVVEARRPDGIYKVSYFDDYHGRLIVENVRASYLSRVKPFISSSYPDQEKPNYSQPRVATSPSTPSSSDDVASKLTELQALRSKGLITEEEYQEKRKKYIDKL